jgi:hypothetical protein
MDVKPSKSGWCKICGQSVDLSSDHQSVGANSIGAHQEPCLHVFCAAMSDMEGKYPETSETLEELLEIASYHLMSRHELVLPYFHWMVELFFYLKRRPEVLKELESKYRAIKVT